MIKNRATRVEIFWILLVLQWYPFLLSMMHCFSFSERPFPTSILFWRNGSLEQVSSSHALSPISYPSQTMGRRPKKASRSFSESLKQRSLSTEFSWSSVIQIIVPSSICCCYPQSGAIPVPRSDCCPLTITLKNHCCLSWLASV